MRATIGYEIWRLVSAQLVQEEQGEGVRVVGSCAGAVERGEKVVGGLAGREEALYAHSPPAGRVWKWAFAPDP